MKVSIIIDNYNYAQFVGAAIESALAQTWPDTEVIVVDDGSTDTSWDVIARYAGRVKALRKENGGQASALNLGFEHSTGELIAVLDSDDLLDPTRVARAVERYRPGVAKVQCQLRSIDRDGRDLDMIFPYYPPDLSSEEIRRRTLGFAEYPCAPASGNVYSREYLGRVMPIPPTFRYNADGYLNLCAPLYGEVETIAEPLAAYRVHGDNHLAKAGISRQSYRSHIGFDLLLRRTFIERAVAMGYQLREEDIPRTKNHVEDRILSLRLAPERHAVPDDSRAGLVRLGIRSAWAAPNVSSFGRILWSAWFVVIGLMPLPVVIYLVNRFRLQRFRTPAARALVALSRRKS